jgi:hypothetical protein
VLRRHGITGPDSPRLTMDAVRALIDGRARADRDAGIDWTRLRRSAGLAGELADVARHDRGGAAL